MGETHVTVSIRVQRSQVVWTGGVPIAAYRELWFGDWFRYLYIQWTSMPVPVFVVRQICQVEDSVPWYLKHSLM